MLLYVFQKPEPLPEILWEPFFFLSLNDFVFRSISFKAKCIKLITFASRLGLKICQWNDNHRSLLESRAVGTWVGRAGGIFPGMRSRSSIAHFLGLTLSSFKYCSYFYLIMFHTYSHSSIAHLERFVRDGEFLWTVNSIGHFLMSTVIQIWLNIRSNKK